MSSGPASSAAVEDGMQLARAALTSNGKHWGHSHNRPTDVIDSYTLGQEASPGFVISTNKHQVIESHYIRLHKAAGLACESMLYACLQTVGMCAGMQYVA